VINASYEKIMKKVANGNVIVLDSGISTELERRGAKMRDTQWSGSVSIEAFDLLVDTHKAYIDAGADVITVNSYASSRLVLDNTKSEENFKEINRKNIEAALEAREKSGVKDILIAGSISHQASWQRDGTRVKAQIETQIPDCELHDAFNEMIGFHENGGVDFLLLEMMNIPYRMKPLFDCVSLSRLPVWCGFSAKRKTENSEITSWHDENISFEEIVKLSLDYNFDVLGIMHTSVDLISDCIQIIKKHHSGAVMAYPDSGYFKSPNWQFSEVISPSELIEFALPWVDNGVNIIGGCCGLGPEHTKQLASLK
tara:strand:- start:212 stop:1147 length:936 start_codon:yes stop_codon:yes gene_type:complete